MAAKPSRPIEEGGKGGEGGGGAERAHVAKVASKSSLISSPHLQGAETHLHGQQDLKARACRQLVYKDPASSPSAWLWHPTHY